MSLDDILQFQEQENTLKDMDCYHLRKNMKKLLDTRLDSLKTTCKKVVHKVSAFLGDKIADFKR